MVPPKKDKFPPWSDLAENLSGDTWESPRSAVGHPGHCRPLFCDGTNRLAAVADAVGTAVCTRTEAHDTGVIRVEDGVGFVEYKLRIIRDIRIFAIANRMIKTSGFESPAIRLTPGI